MKDYDVMKKNEVCKKLTIRAMRFFFCNIWQVHLVCDGALDRKEQSVVYFTLWPKL